MNRAWLQQLSVVQSGSGDETKDWIQISEDSVSSKVKTTDISNLDSAAKRCRETRAWKVFDVDRFIMVVNCLLWFFIIKIKDAYNCQPKKVKCRINVFDVQIKLVRPGRAGVVRSAGGAREAVLLVAGFFQLVAWVCLFKWHSEFPSNAKFSCTISSSSWPPLCVERT